jgi:hypothetical protein
MIKNKHSKTTITRKKNKRSGGGVRLKLTEAFLI